jgi:hypothetical protein
MQIRIDRSVHSARRSGLHRYMGVSVLIVHWEKTRFRLLIQKDLNAHTQAQAQARMAWMAQMGGRNRG